MSKADRFKGYVINESGPKPETARTEAERAALRARRKRINKIDDMEFAKKLGIFSDLY